jgi:hypothetical protein
MDPWLEQPTVWSGLHASLIIYMRDALQPLVSPRYVAAVEERVYVAATERVIAPDLSVRTSQPTASQPGGIAVLEPDDAVILETMDDEIHEPYLEILDRDTGEQIVTVIELLSPTNKQKGAGRKLYQKKQREVLQSKANLVEIDLVRRGPHTLAVPKAQAQSLGVYDYLVSVSRAKDRSKRFLLYPRVVRDRLPRIAIPLRKDDREVTLDLQPIFDRCYEASRYGGRIDYSRPCVPRLRPDDESWARERIEAWQAARSA